MTTNRMNDADTNTTIRIDADIQRFLEEVCSGQCLSLAAWAARILRVGTLAMADLERCFGLGFES